MLTHMAFQHAAPYFFLGVQERSLAGWDGSCSMG